MYKTKSTKVKEKMDVGIVGESFFTDYVYEKDFKSLYKKCFDLRGTPIERDYDIDFLLSKEDVNIDINDLAEQEKIRQYLKSISSKDDIKEKPFVGVEVKTDTRILTTNNIVYDITSHDKTGGLARSETTFIIYCFVDENNVVVKYAIINMLRLRRFMRENHYNIWKPDSGIKSLNFKDDENELDGNSWVLLIDIDLLAKNKIAKISNYG